MEWEVYLNEKFEEAWTEYNDKQLSLKDFAQLMFLKGILSSVKHENIELKKRLISLRSRE